MSLKQDEFQAQQILQFSNSSSQYYLGNPSSIPPGVLSNYLLYQETGEAAYLEDAFYFAEKKKSLTLLSAVRQHQLKKGPNEIPIEWLEQEQSLKQQIAQLQLRQMQRIKRGDLEDMEIDISNTPLSQAKQEVDSIQDLISKHHPEFFLEHQLLHPANVQALQQQLPEDALLVEFVVNLEGESTKNFIITISKEDLQIDLLECGCKVDYQIDHLQNMVKRSSLIQESRRKEFIQLSHEIYEHLLAPIEHRLKGKKQLIIIGDILIELLPFELLLPSPEIKSFQELDYLVRDFEISYHRSATLYLQSLNTQQPATPKYISLRPLYSREKRSTISSV